MSVRISLTACMASALLPGLPALAESCPLGPYRAETGAGTYVYEEPSGGFSEAEGRITLIRDGAAVWSLATVRSCGVGYPLCELAVRYVDADGQARVVSVPIDSGRVGAGSTPAVCVIGMAQLGQRLALTIRTATDAGGATDLRFVPGQQDLPAPEPADLAAEWVPVFYLAAPEG